MIKEFENYLRYLSEVKHYSDKTVSSYGFDLTDFSNYLNENKLNVLEINENDIKLYMNGLKINNYAISSINRKIVCLRNFYKYYTKHEDENFISPMLNYNTLKAPRRLPKDLFNEQVKALLKPCEKKKEYIIRNQCIIMLLFNSGMRVSECANLNVNDVDLEERMLRVFGKGKKERTTYFMPSVVSFLYEYINNIRPSLLLDPNDEALFIGSKGTRITTRAIELMLNERASKTNPPFKVSPHMLRHTFATNLLNNNVDLKIVQELLGHASLSTTQIYTHVSKAHLKEVYEKTHPIAIKMNEYKNKN